ncbi:MAG: Fic family protein [Actinobacteria bacterium]|nr:Fic family protein [Actinomycetota bacterium]
MDLDALRGSPIGRLVPISGVDGRTGDSYDAFAFLPEALPREVDLSSETWNAVVEASAALGRLDEASRKVPDPSLLTQPSLRREAQSTSALEGTFAPLEAVFESEAEHRTATAEVREVLNYVSTAEEAFKWISDRPVTRGLIEGLQLSLVRGTAGELGDAGGLRQIQVFIGPRNSPIDHARFVPPPPGDRLAAGLDDWIGWINDPPVALPAVVQAAIAHYQFETLHPFSDGNGRLGRLLIVVQLMMRELLEQPILVVSPWFEARRAEYQDELLRLSQTGEWDCWVRFFAVGVRDSAESNRRKILRLLTLQEDQIRIVRGAGGFGVAERLAGELIGSPVLRASQVAKRHGVSSQAAMNALRKLADLGILEERRRPGRVIFVAPDVLRELR